MALFYKRNEYQHEIVIEYPAWPYIATTALLPLLILGVILQSQMQVPYLVDVVFFLFLGLTLARLIGQWKTNKEVRQAMGSGNVTMTGTRYSLKNPVTITIKK